MILLVLKMNFKNKFKTEQICIKIKNIILNSQILEHFLIYDSLKAKIIKDIKM